MSAPRLPRSALAPIDSQADAPFAAVDSEPGRQVRAQVRPHRKYNYGQHFKSLHRTLVRGKGSATEHGSNVIDPFAPPAEREAQLLKSQYTNVAPADIGQARHERSMEKFKAAYKRDRGTERRRKLLGPLMTHLAGLPSSAPYQRAFARRIVKKKRRHVRGRGAY